MRDDRPAYDSGAQRMLVQRAPRATGFARQILLTVAFARAQWDDWEDCVDRYQRLIEQILEAPSGAPCGKQDFCEPFTEGGPRSKVVGNGLEGRSCHLHAAGR